MVMVNGQGLRALAHYSAPLPTRSLRQQVGNLAHQASVLIAAMDMVGSGILQHLGLLFIPASVAWWF